MKELTKDEQSYVETLNIVAEEITQRIISSTNEKGEPKYLHFFDMWKAFMGGFICKELSELTDVSDEQLALVNEYTPETIEKMFTKTIQVEVPVEVEKIVERIVEKRVEIPVTTTTTGAVTSTSSGERRRPHKRTRATEKIRELLPQERVFMISKFNELQRLIDKDSSEAKGFAEILNESAYRNGYASIFPSQLAGYWSVLCKRVCGIDGTVDSYISNAVKTGKLLPGSPIPHASDEFKKAILINLMESKNEAKRIAEYQAIYRGLFNTAPTV